MCLLLCSCLPAPLSKTTKVQNESAAAVSDSGGHFSRDGSRTQRCAQYTHLHLRWSCTHAKGSLSRLTIANSHLHSIADTTPHARLVLQIEAWFKRRRIRDRAADKRAAGEQKQPIIGATEPASSRQEKPKHTPQPPRAEAAGNTSAHLIGARSAHLFSLGWLSVLAPSRAARGQT